MIRSVIILTLMLFITSCNSEEEPVRETTTTTRHLDFTSEIDFEREDGQIISTVEVAVADDDESRTEGLMDVTNLPENAGMLFVFDTNEPRSFWMAGTPLSLDIIFVDENYEIVRIHRNTPPYSHDSILSGDPAKYVVEVNASYTLRHDIVEGMRINIRE